MTSIHRAVPVIEFKRRFRQRAPRFTAVAHMHGPPSRRRHTGRRSSVGNGRRRRGVRRFSGSDHELTSWQSKPWEAASRPTEFGATPRWCNGQHPALSRSCVQLSSGFDSPPGKLLVFDDCIPAVPVSRSEPPSRESDLEQHGGSSCDPIWRGPLTPWNLFQAIQLSRPLRSLFQAYSHGGCRL